MIRILHTSDWHLGGNLYEEKRNDELQLVLDWLRQTIIDQKIDVLLVSGDVFDTVNPSNEARNMYYKFLANVAKDAQCQNVVITGGNHDSASMLEAPKEILAMLQTFVVGQACPSIRDEVIPISIDGETPDLIVCAVPFLGVRDVCKSIPGETPEDLTARYCRGVAKHYEEVAGYARALRENSDRFLPIVGMGHLYVSGAAVSEGERQIVGNLDGMSADIFGSSFDYVALGHIHVPQIVARNPFIRYSGSPIPVSFSECRSAKTVCIVSFDDDNPTPQIETLNVPRFQKMQSIEGNSLEEIMKKLDKCIEESSLNDETIWIQILCKSERHIPSLSNTIRDRTANTRVKCLRVANQTILASYLRNEHAHAEITLKELTPEDVFKNLLSAKRVDGEKADAYLHAFKTILEEISKQEN